MCLTLQWTSAHSSNSKWATRGGINSPQRHRAVGSTATEKGTVGWTDGLFLVGVGSSGATSRCLPAPRLPRNSSDVSTDAAVGSSDATCLRAETSLEVDIWNMLWPMLPSDIASVLPVVDDFLAQTLCIEIFELCFDRWSSFIGRRFIRCSILLLLLLLLRRLHRRLFDQSSVHPMVVTRICLNFTDWSFENTVFWRL